MSALVYSMCDGAKMKIASEYMNILPSNEFSIARKSIQIVIFEAVPPSNNLKLGNNSTIWEYFKLCTGNKMRSRNNESSLPSKHVLTIEIHVTNLSLNIGTEFVSYSHHKLEKKFSFRIKYLRTMSYKMSSKTPTIPEWIIQYFDASNKQFGWIKKVSISQFLDKNITRLQLSIRVVTTLYDWVEWFTYMTKFAVKFNVHSFY